jgi:hypothetical protein
MSARTRRLVRTATIALMLAAGLAACGTATAPGAGGSRTAPATSPSSAVPRSPTPAVTSPSPGPSATQSAPAAPSAADQLAGFFSAAEAADSQLRQAAALVNEGIGTTSMNFPPATLAAVKALSTKEVAQAIPAGLPTELLRQTLLVYSDLESRTVSLARVSAYSDEYPLKLSSQDGKYVYTCLGNGAPAAARFGADLAGLRAAALAAPPVTPAAPDSRAAAELALRLLSIDKHNSGCDACGGFVATTLAPVVWTSQSGGTINGIRFAVIYHAGTGWQAEIWAC